MVNQAFLKYVREEHYCPHCNQRLSCCSTPPIHVGDGLGWGTEVFFVCLNDECSLYVSGWKHIEEEYGQVASYRYMELPGETSGTPIMVGSKMAFTGSVIDPDEAEAADTRLQTEKAALARLDTCVAENDLEPVLTLITDEEAKLDGRRRACEVLAEFSTTDCIDPIRNHKFRHTEIGQLANLAIGKILKKTFQKECPYCAEIIKAQAKVCKHCGKEQKE